MAAKWREPEAVLDREPNPDTAGRAAACPPLASPILRESARYRAPERENGFSGMRGAIDGIGDRVRGRNPVATHVRLGFALALGAFLRILRLVLVPLPTRG